MRDRFVSGEDAVGARHCPQFIDVAGVGDARRGLIAGIPLGVCARVVQQVRSDLPPSEIDVGGDEAHARRLAIGQQRHTGLMTVGTTSGLVHLL
jgi:hypothetical protein